MADKQISALTPAEEITTSDLFVCQQNNQAKSVSGQLLISELAEALAGHGGIASIALTSTAGTVKTYTITYADGSTFDYQVSDGARGYTGANAYVHIRYAAEYPVQTILTTPNNYIGIYSGTSSSAPTSVSQYTWFQWKGEKGDQGVSIRTITKVGSSGLVDTYIINMSNGTNYGFTVKNGSSIQNISKSSSSGLVDTYVIRTTDGELTAFNVTNAKSITGISLVSGTHAPGGTDVYRIMFNDYDSVDFSVYNGANGEGAVSTVAGVPVVGEQGDVPLIKVQSSAPTTSTAGYVNQLLFDTTGGVLYICTDATDGVYTWRGAAVTVDSTLSSSSTNPVQNKVIYTALTGKVDTTCKVNGKALSTDITLSPSDVGAVPTSRTINGDALTADIVTRLVFSNTTVAAASWEADSTYSDYDYKAEISLNGVTPTMVPEVVFDPDDAVSGNFAPVATSDEDIITIYAKESPEDAIVIPTIICFV